MNNNDMQIFNYNGADCRTIESDDGIWWVLRDVCTAIGISDHVTVAKRLDEDEVGLAQVTDVYGREQKTYIINEAGLYNVIIRSDKPSAKDFKRWVTHEVIPSIRKTGTYSTQHPQLTPAQLIAAQAQVLVDMEQKMLSIQSQAQAIEAQQAELAQRVDTAIKVFSRPSEDHWKADIDQAIKDLCEERHLSDCATRGRMYRELEEKCGCNINTRLTRLRQRVKKQGVRYRDAKALNKLDAIAADKQLRAAFEGIVREWQARSAVVDGQQSIEPIQKNFFENA